MSSINPTPGYNPNFNVNLNDAKKLVRIGRGLEPDSQFPNFPKNALVSEDYKPYFDKDFNFRGGNPTNLNGDIHGIDGQQTQLLKNALNWSASSNAGRSFLQPGEGEQFISQDKAIGANSLFLTLTDKEGHIRPEFDLAENGRLGSKDLEKLAAKDGDANNISDEDLKMAQEEYAKKNTLNQGTQPASNAAA